ncbi:MAG: ABC transporter permease [Acidimicrobiales bacterium]
MNPFGAGFIFIANHGHLLLDKTGTYLVLSFEAIAISLVIGVPLGLVLGHLHKGSFLAINISNVGRALPSLAVLAILLPVFGIGRLNVVIALVILGAPPILTNTYTAIDQVDADVVEAAKGMGMRPREVITRVELPLALPVTFAGIRTSAVFVIATATLAGFFGGGGLGDIIAEESNYKLAGVLGASYLIIVLAILTQIVFKALEMAVTPRGLRKRGLRKPRSRTPHPGLDPTLALVDSAA